MVEFEATLEVTQWLEICQQDRMDGDDRINKRITTEQEHTVQITEEFPDGHVNLEAWIPSLSPDVFYEKMTDEMSVWFDGEVEVEVKDVLIYGTVHEWIVQIERYISERPDMDFSDGMHYFKNCEEVDMPGAVIDTLLA